MLVLCVWLMGLIILLSLCVLQSPRMLLTPQFGFIGCFIPQAVSLFFYLPMWDTDISVKTVILTLSGVTIFFVASLFFNKMFNGSKRYSLKFSSISPREYNSQKEIVIEKWKLIIFLGLQLLAMFFTIQYYTKNVPGATLIEKIAQYNSINKFTADDVYIVLPKWISYAKHMCEVSGYMFGYILVHSIVFKYRQNRTLLFLNIIVSILIMSLSGGRSSMVCCIISLVIESYIVWGKSNNWRKKLKMNAFLKALAIACTIFATFPFLASLLGRKVTSFSDHMVQYTAGPYKNLDIYVSRGKFGSDFSDWQTFYSIIQSLGRNFGISQWIHKQDLPFQHVNGYNMGNVYTAFHAFLHDGGYPAFVFFLILEALLMQWFYKKAMNTRSRYSINLNEIFYAFIYSKIIMSFFYDWFYSTTIFSIGTVRMLIAWWILRGYLTGIRFKETVKVRKISFKRATPGYWRA